MKPLVSICIPTFKQKEYLQKCLTSVLEQSFLDFELIISDDTPDDSIEHFLKSFLKDHPYSYSRNNPALGNPENWNAAIARAKGKYIKILHHDDFFTQKNSLEIMVKEIEAKQAAFIFCASDVWDTQSNQHRRHFISPKQYNLLAEYPELLFFKNCIGAPSATLYVNDNTFAYDKRLKWLVDVDLYLQFLFRKKKIIAIDEALICTAHAAEGQVTSAVINDKSIQIKEHVLLYQKIKSQTDCKANFTSFFDRLFYQYSINTLDELFALVPEAKSDEPFFKNIISNLNSNRFFKHLKKRFFESRYNNYIFKIEEFI